MVFILGTKKYWKKLLKTLKTKNMKVWYLLFFRILAWSYRRIQI